MKTYNIMIVGVGGQGTLLASRIFGEVFPSLGYDVKISEVHGMSQRGGSVVTFVRYGDKVESPIVEKGTADLILAFEILEAARWSEYLAKGGTIIASSQKIDPMPVITGVCDYPAELGEKLKNKGINLIEKDALTVAEECGSAKAVNTVLIGIAAKTLNLAPEAFLSAIDSLVKEKFRELNRKAFKAGYELL